MKRNLTVTTPFFCSRRPPLAGLAYNCLLLVLSVLFLDSCERETKNDGTGPDDRGIVWTRNSERSSEAGLLSLSSADVSGGDGISVLDVLIYDDDSLRRLDSWHRFTELDRELTLLSGDGPKIFVFIANYTRLPDVSVSDVGSFDALAGFEVHLSDEDVSRPVMTAVLKAEAGEDLRTVRLEPLMAQVKLGRVSWNFSGKEYENESLKNVCAYLINVSASTQILRDSLFVPTDVLNYGGLIESDMSSLSSRSLLYREMPDFGARFGFNADAEFFCYPNDISEESMGQPFTRLVLQADIGDETCYYPISVNHPGFGYSGGTHGLSRNVRYCVNLKITSKGCDSPEGDIPVEDITEGWMLLYPGQYLRRKVGEDVRIWVEVCPENTEVIFDREDLDDDVAEGYYTYELEDDGRAVVLHLLRPGMGMFCVDAGPPVNNGFLILVIID